ncbi:Nuclease-related domain [Mycobacteroides abscessus subsp. abscessus]|nr:Nuclease-related domain [Mycobacteroides abscessus subsp. abscessus]
MIVKERGISMELQVFRCLKNRMVFTEKEKTYYINLEKGYLGELKFDELTKILVDDCLIIKDLTLEITNNIFQIDSLLIFKDMLCVFEVKNYEDNFYFQSNKWYTMPSRKEINNPILQLDRSETLLRKYFQAHRFSIPIESKIVFVNPTFTLYQAPIDLPVVFPTQLQHLQSTLKSKRGTLTTQQTKLAKQLYDDHMVTTPFLRVPRYNYESLRKGLECRGCGEFYKQWGEVLLHCKNCGDFESVEAAFVRTVKEFKILFAERKITTNEIYDWCRIIPSMRLVRLLLNRYLNARGNGRSTYYEFP